MTEQQEQLIHVLNGAAQGISAAEKTITPTQITAYLVIPEKSHLTNDYRFQGLDLKRVQTFKQNSFQ